MLPDDYLEMLSFDCLLVKEVPHFCNLLLLWLTKLEEKALWRRVSVLESESPPLLFRWMMRRPSQREVGLEHFPFPHLLMLPYDF